MPSWIRAERERKLQAEEGSDLPFPVYLIGSALVAIAAVRGSPSMTQYEGSACCMQDMQLVYETSIIPFSMRMAAQVGSIFEFANKNAIFGVVKPDNFLWAPIPSVLCHHWLSLCWYAGALASQYTGVLCCDCMHGLCMQAWCRQAGDPYVCCACSVPVPQSHQLCQQGVRAPGQAGRLLM